MSQILFFMKSNLDVNSETFFEDRIKEKEQKRMEQYLLALENPPVVPTREEIPLRRVIFSELK